MKICKVAILTILAFISAVAAQNNDACTGTKPNINTDCHVNSNSNSYCCYRVDDTQTSKTCASIKKSAYTSSQFSLNGVTYNQDCGLAAQGRPVDTGVTFKNQTSTSTNVNSLKLPFNACGVSNPILSGECTDYSIFGNSCCFFQKGLSSGCYWLGQRFVGNQTTSEFSITCAATFLNFKFAFLFLIFAMIFI